MRVVGQDAEALIIMNISLSDIDALKDLRDHLSRLTEVAKSGYGWTYDDEIALLNRVIEVLES